jgi:hypothetical protein
MQEAAVGVSYGPLKYGPLRDVRHRKQFHLGRRFFQQPG